ncbi:MAG TPA: ACR3 family arsenite efflux transporter [Bacteroidia bacterium]
MKTRLKFLDRYLTLWIFLAMALGILLGSIFPGIPAMIENMSNGSTNLPMALGLILMMYPPLAKVKLEKIPALFKNSKLLFISLGITWIVGPLLMFLLAFTFLGDNPEYFTGLILIGIAPCIAMVIVWNELAGGNRELCAALVGINSLLQVLFFSAYAYFYLEVMPPLFGLKANVIDISMSEIAKTVGIYLGIPFLMGVLGRYMLVKTKGEDWYDRKYIPSISPITLVALLLTIVIMFSMKGSAIISLPFDVLKLSIPLVLYFVIMFVLTFWITWKLGAVYKDAATLSFTASGNNFELAIAVSIGIFGINSPQAFAGVIGPLVEVPALIALVNLAYYFKTRLFKEK